LTSTVKAKKKIQSKSRSKGNRKDMEPNELKKEITNFKFIIDLQSVVICRKHTKER